MRTNFNRGSGKFGFAHGPDFFLWQPRSGPRPIISEISQQEVPSLAIQEAQMSVPKNEENAPAGESANQRSKRRKDKLIRLDDLVPKQDVKGGRQLLFGATETTQTTKPTKAK